MYFVKYTILLLNSFIISNFENFAIQVVKNILTNFNILRHVLKKFACKIKYIVKS